MSSSQLQWAVAGGLAGWAAVRLTGADRIRRAEDWVAPAMSFTPQAAAGAWAAALLLRGRGPRAAAALAAAALTAAVAPRAVPHRQSHAARRAAPHLQPPADGPVLRVLTANLLVGRADADALVEITARTDADVLLVQELTDDAVARLEKAGLAQLLPYQVLESVPQGSRGNGIYARYDLASGDGVAPVDPGRPACRLTLPSGQSAQVVCVHTRAPTPRWGRNAAARWASELEMLPGPGEDPVILAGDFNATLDHAPMRAVLRRGYRDAAEQVGKGLVPTWGPRAGRRPGLLVIDHVLVDPRCTVQAVAAYNLPGTDHRVLLAEVRLPG